MCGLNKAVQWTRQARLRDQEHKQVVVMRPVFNYKLNFLCQLQKIIQNNNVVGMQR